MYNKRNRGGKIMNERELEDKLTPIKNDIEDLKADLQVLRDSINKLDSFKYTISEQVNCLNKNSGYTIYDYMKDKGRYYQTHCSS